MSRACRRISSMSSPNTSNEIGCTVMRSSSRSAKSAYSVKPAFHMSVGLVVNPATRGFSASVRMLSRSAPSAKTFTVRSCSTAGSLALDAAEEVLDSTLEVGGAGIRLRVSDALVRACGLHDQDGPAAGSGAGHDIAVGVADHPGAREVDVELGRSREQHSRGGLPAVANLGELGNDSLRVMKA